MSVWRISNLLGLGISGFLVVSSWFVLHPLGFRLYLHTPVSVDPMSYAFMGLALQYFLTGNQILFCLSLFGGLLAKESFLFIAFCFIASILIELLSHSFGSSNNDWVAKWRIRSSEYKIKGLQMLGIVSAIAAYSLVKGYVVKGLFPPLNGHAPSSIDMVLWWFNEVYADPYRLLIWLGAFFVSTGAFSSLIVVGWPINIDRSHLKVYSFLLLSALGFTLFGLLAGADMSRIIFNGNLFILLFFLYSLKTKYPTSDQYIGLALFFGILVALSYTHFFPSTFEYGYYQHKTVYKEAYFLSLMIVLNIALAFIGKKFLKNEAGAGSACNITMNES